MAAANAIDRTGGIVEVVASSSLLDELDDVDVKSTSNEEDELEDDFFLLSDISYDAILSLHPFSNSGIAIFCTGVGPSIKPNPWRLLTSPVTASTNSVSNPNLDHSNVPSFDVLAGKESSKDDFGDENGNDDLDDKLLSLLILLFEVSGEGVEVVVV